MRTAPSHSEQLIIIAMSEGLLSVSVGVPSQTISIHASSEVPPHSS